jgi:acylphosphatase
MSSPAVRRRVHYSGRVQGVGFRAASERLARGRGVGGYVRNLPDGRVELVAEGAPAEVDALLSDVRHALKGYIRDEQVGDEPPDDPPTSEFSIRY